MSKFKFKLITRVLPLLPPKVYRTKGIQLDFLSKDQIYFSVSLNQSPSIHVDNFSLFFSNLYQNEFQVKFSSPSSQNINFKISNPSILTFSNAFNINFHQPILTITNPKISNPYVIAPFKEPLKNKAYSIDFVLHQSTFSIDKLQLPEVTYSSYKRTLSKLLKQVTQALDNIINYFEEIPEANININLTNILYDFPDIFISKNLFRPIGVTRAYGMNYAHKYFTLITFPKLPKTEQASEKEKSTRRQVKIRQQEFTNVANDVTAPSIWDLIFVILQPPLDFSSKNLFLPSDLYPYQVKGVDFLIKNQHALLADDMGTGKTVMTICALKILFRQRKIRHALILCPPTVLLEWERHLRDWSPELAVFYVKGNANLRRIVWKKEFHVYVSSYDTFSRDVHYGNIDKKLFEYFDVVILDEAHHIRNPQSKRSQAIRKLKPRYRWALTGTPIQNRIEDLLSIFDFVYPNYLSTYAASDLQSSYSTNRIKEAIKPYFLRRRKSEVLSDLPPKQRQEFWIVMNEHQRKVYESAEAGIRQEVIDMLVGSDKIDEQLIKTHIFSKIQRLKQIINFPPNSLDSPKVDLLKEQVDEIVQSDSKVIIFSQYIDEGIKKIKECLQGYKTAEILGQQSPSLRRKQIEIFKNSNDVRILLASIKSGGEGLNLTEASYVIHFDHWWNPAVMWQAEDRVHRRGQTRGVNVYSYWVKETIDERIHAILKHKGWLFQEVIDDLSEEKIEDKMTLDDYLRILGINREQIVDRKQTEPHINSQAITIDQIREKLLDLTPERFEELTRDLLIHLGFPNVMLTGKSGDGGIDLVAVQNTQTGIEKVVVQCKRYRGNLGVQIARNFLGAMSADASIKQGLLITTGQFTRNCLHFCSVNNIRTVDGFEVAKYVKQFGLDSHLV